jgi:hypothetical protein
MPFYPPNGSRELREGLRPLQNTPCIWQNRSGIVPDITALEPDFEVYKC